MLLFAIRLGILPPLHTTARAQTAPAPHYIIPQIPHIPRPSPRSGAVHVERVRADVEIRDQIAATTLDLELRNDSGRAQEAVLLLPVPPGATVSRFLYGEGEHTSSATLLPAAEARRIYEQIVARRRDPALLEFVGYALIRSSLFPVPAGGREQVRLTYEQVLQGNGQRLDYLLPRSHALASDTPWELSLTLQATLPISGLFSPSHEVIQEQRDDGRYTLHLAHAEHPEPGPFRLSFLRGYEAGEASILAYADPDRSGDGYFLLLAGVAPRGGVTPLTREVTLVLDRSGSMAGAKLDRARAAARQVIGGLREGEWFNIIDYANGISRFSAVPVRWGSESVPEAFAYLDALRPLGGTNLQGALEAALTQEPAPDAVPLTLFLTDGVATIGDTNERRSTRLAEEDNIHQRRIFALGVGSDVNAPLLDRISECSGGRATFILDDRDLELRVAELFQRLNGPLLLEPRLRPRQAEVVAAGSRRRGTIPRLHDLLPAPIPDLFAGELLTIVGRYEGSSPLDLELCGRRGDRLETLPVTLDPKAADTRNSFVARLWAGRQIAILSDALRQAGAAGEDARSILAQPRQQELLDEILRLSTEFGILTEYTAFLAREDTEVWTDAQLRAGGMEMMAERALLRRSGLGGVSQSLNLQRLKRGPVASARNEYLDAEMCLATPDGEVRAVAGRAFFRRHGRWVESRFLRDTPQPRPARVLRLGTDLYSDLLWWLAARGEQALFSLPGETLLQLDDEVLLIQN
jgi:Ca-activated chloride channel family protein